MPYLSLVKVYHYIYCWLFTLLVGLILVALFSGPFALAVTAVAGVLSAPFMVVFCILIFFYLKKKPSKLQLHQRTLIYHIIGSVLTVLLFTLAIDEVLPVGLYAGIFGYFVIDSCFFHWYIQHRQEVPEQRKHSKDILDSPIDSFEKTY